MGAVHGLRATTPERTWADLCTRGAPWTPEDLIAAGDHLQVGASGKVKKFTVGTDPEPARIGLCIQGQGTADYDAAAGWLNALREVPDDALGV